MTDDSGTDLVDDHDDRDEHDADHAEADAAAEAYAAQTGYRHRKVNDADTRIWTRKGVARRVRPLGPPELGTTLIWDPAAVRRKQGQFERKLANFLGIEHAAWLMRELEIDVVLDVGANTGQYAMGLRNRGFEGRIVSFEPVPDIVENLRANAADDPNWLVMDYALGDEDTTSEINFSTGLVSSLLPPSEFGKTWSKRLRDQHETRTITIRRLDSVWDEVLAGLDSPRVYLKMDTQGYDVAAFTGGGARLQEIYGMQSEVAMVPIYEGMPRFAEQLTAYEAGGFQTTGIFPVTRDRKTMRAIEFDLMMIGPAGLAERAQD